MSFGRARVLGVVLGSVLGAGASAALLIAWLNQSAFEPASPARLAAPKPAIASATGAATGSTESATGAVNIHAAASMAPALTRPKAARASAKPLNVLPTLTTVYEWPREPEAPAEIDDARFAEALVVLCGLHGDREVRPWYAPFLLRAAREFNVDPFLLGALMSRASACKNDGRGFRAGLLGFDPSLYQDDVKAGAYHYRVFDPEAGTATAGAPSGSAARGWSERSLSLSRFPFEPKFFVSPESNLYFAAAFLRAWADQARGLRAAFVQRTEYRHFVSHYFWGDQVKSHREEDWVLVERRRFLEYYGTLSPRPPVRFRGFELGCPLDGCPRIITSTLGDSRAGGGRVHAGNDFESTVGEPVRAVADGKVVFAGVDLPGRGAASKIPIWAQRNVDPGEMGAGGLYVCVDHGVSSEGQSLVSCYMHLDAATVVQSREVKRGDQIGRVGASGIKESRPHLHFELHSQAGSYRAAEVLVGLAIGNPALRPPPEGAVEMRPEASL